MRRLTLAAALWSTAAAAGDPVLFARVTNFAVPATGSVPLPLAAIESPWPALVMLSTNLAPNVTVSLSANGTTWIEMSGELGTQRTPNAGFDINDMPGRTFAVRAKSTNGGVGTIFSLELVIVPINGAFDLQQAAPSTPMPSTWGPAAPSAAARVAGESLVLASATVRGASSSPGAGLRLAVGDGGLRFPQNGDAGDQSWFYSGSTDQVGALLMGGVVLPLNARAQLEAIAGPSRDGGTTMGNADMLHRRVAIVPLAALNSGVAFNVATMVTLNNLTPGQPYVVMQLAYARLRGPGNARVDFTLDSAVAATTTLSPFSDSALPMAHFGVVTPLQTQVSFETIGVGNHEFYGHFNGLFGPFDGGVIDLMLNQTMVDGGVPADGGTLLPPDGGGDAGSANDGGAVDAGGPDSGTTQPGTPPKFTSTPPSSVQCKSKLVYRPQLEGTLPVRLSLEVKPATATVEGDSVVWLPRFEDQPGQHFVLVAENEFGKDRQETDVSLSGCELEFETCGCSSTPFAPLLLLLLSAARRRARRHCS